MFACWPTAAVLHILLPGMCTWPETRPRPWPKLVMGRCR